jgi:hypothetical protein
MPAQITKKEFSALDAAPSIQYAKQDTTADKAFPLTSTPDGVKNRLDVNTGMSALPGFSIPPFDRIDATYPDTVTEVYVYSLSGSTLNTVTVIYTDTTKKLILSAVKT